MQEQRQYDSIHHLLVQTGITGLMRHWFIGKLLSPVLTLLGCFATETLMYCIFNAHLIQLRHLNCNFMFHIC